MSHEIYRQDPKISTSKVWYSHVREEVLTNKTEKDGKPVFSKELVRTVAAIEDGDFVHVGLALRNPKDLNFNKRIGREIAGGRAKFAMAKARKLTNRHGRPSRFDTILTVSKKEFAEVADGLGVVLPKEKALKDHEMTSQFEQQIYELAR